MTYACIESGCQSYYGCPSYLMYYSHKCPSYILTSFVMEPMESFSRWNKSKICGEVHTDLMEPEVGECREYGTLGNWINTLDCRI